MKLSASDESNKMLIINAGIPLAVLLDPNINNISIASKKIVNKTLTNTGWVINHAGNDLDEITCKGDTYTRRGREASYYSFGDNLGYITSNLLYKTLGLSHNDLEYKEGPKQWGSIEARLTALYRAYKMDKERLGNIAEYGAEKFASIFGGKVKSSNAFMSPAKYKKARAGGYLPLADTFIIYNGVMYWGYFTSFNLSQSANNQLSKSYDFKFMVTNSSKDLFTNLFYDMLPQLRWALAAGSAITILRYLASFTMSGKLEVAASDLL